MSAYELNKTILKNSANLKAYYRFESGALTTDSSSNGYTLTNNNTVADGTGKYGGAADFGSSNTNKSLTIANNFGIDGGACSISLWFNPSAQPATNGFFDIAIQYSTTSDTGYIIRYYDTGGTKKVYLQRRKFGDADQGVDFTKTLSNGTWYHLVLTYNGTTVRGYIDGTHVGSAAASGNGISNVASSFNLGFEPNGSTRYTSGLIDDCAVFNTALSADQVKELYEGRYIGEWLPQSGLVGLWHLNGNSTDFSGNNNHGTDTAITYSLANGKIAQGAGFNGSTSILSITNTASLRPATSFSILGWFKQNGGTNIGSIFQSYSANTAIAGINLYRDTGSNKLSFLIGKNTGTTANVDYKLLVSNKDLNDNVWHFVAGVYDGSNMYIYIDGSQDNTVANTINPAYAATNYIRIGTFVSNGTENKISACSMDEILVFSRALTAAEIRHWYAWSRGKYL